MKINFTKRPDGNPLSTRFATAFIAALLGVSCATSFRDVHPPGKGSVLNPVKCDMPEGERRYLKRLRTPADQPVQYEYYDSVIGAEGRILDRFLLRNPARSGEGPIADETEPQSIRIYMDMYHRDTVENEPVPGFRFFQGE